MMPRTKRVFGLGAVILVSGFLALNAVAYMHAFRMTHFSQEGKCTESAEKLSFAQKVVVLFTGINARRPSSSVSPDEIDPPYRRVGIPSAGSDILLGGWYSSMGDSAGLVVLFHGYASEKTSMLKEAAAFRELGLSALLVDFRGSGESTESYTTIGYDEAQDVVSAVLFAQANLPHSKLVLFGQSMGAAAVLGAIKNGNVKPYAVIIESVFDRVLNAIRNRFHMLGLPSFPAAELVALWGGVQNSFNAFSHNPVEYAASVSCPILFLHGTRDPKALLAEGRCVFEAVTCSKKFVEFPGCIHESLIGCDRERWTAAVIKFLDSAVLKGRTVSQAL
jgi:alpha-beta hydrolase superfamily lysophospholipase